MSIIIFSVFVLILGLLFALGHLSLNRKKDKVKVLLSNKAVNYILGCYVIILLLCMIVIYIVPQGNFIKSQGANFGKSYDALKKGDLKEIKAMSNSKMWSFKTNFNKVKINTSSVLYSDYIFIRRKAINDGKIEVLSYNANFMNQGTNYFNFSKKVNSLKLVLNGNELTVVKPKSQEIDFYSFRHELPSVQFNKSNNNYSDAGLTNVYGIICYVPKNMQVLMVKN